jgi:hypothetical protein
VHAGLWLDGLRRRDYDSAYYEAEQYASMDFWKPLMRATALAYLGRTERARADVERLLRIKSNFRQRGHWFITRYVKFEELVERVTDGLEIAGLHLA